MKVVTRGTARPWRGEDWGMSKRLIAVGEDQSDLVEGQRR